MREHVTEADSIPARDGFTRALRQTLEIPEREEIGRLHAIDVIDDLLEDVLSRRVMPYSRA